MGIAERYAVIRRSIPASVRLVLAVKGRLPEEVKEVIDAGATDLGENYVQEAEDMYAALGDYAKRVRWHMIGSLQKGKVNKALKIFNSIQTIDSLELARAISKRASCSIPVLLEINIGDEHMKSGIRPEYMAVKQLAIDVMKLEHLRLEGIMTMGPAIEPEDLRPYFRMAKEIYDRLRREGIGIDVLSMGMSDSYKIAIEEGSNMVRLGTAVFGRWLSI